MSTTPVYGLVAEFEQPEQLVAAAKRAREAGFRDVDAYTPFPVHGLAEALKFNDIRVPWMIFFGGVFGAIAGYALQYWVSAIDYPMNIGGRPYHSWPNFIPITFETTVLFAAGTAFLGMLGLNGLPKPYHPIFSAPNFDRATSDRFFLCIEATDPKFSVENTRLFLNGLKPVAVSEVFGVPDDPEDPEAVQADAETQLAGHQAG